MSLSCDWCKSKIEGFLRTGILACCEVGVGIDLSGESVVDRDTVENCFRVRQLFLVRARKGEVVCTSNARDTLSTKGI